MSDTPYPEHEKLASVSERSNEIGNFMDWLMEEKSIWLAVRRGYDLEPVVTGVAEVQNLLAEYFGIDQDAINREKEAMMEVLRKENQ